MDAQSFFECLEAVNQGCQMARELETKVTSAIGSNLPKTIWDYSVEIVGTFSGILGMVTPYCQGIEISPAKHYQKKPSFSSPRSGGGSSFSSPRSRRRSPMGCSSPSEMLDGYVNRSWRNSGKLKFHELAKSSENEGSRKEEELTISTKRGLKTRVIQTVFANSSDSKNYIPPEDGYKWRKYAQKSILGYQHPRRYYRCTSDKNRTCQVKKFVQRRNDNPLELEVTYIGDHSCQCDTQIFKTPTPSLISEIQNSNTNPNSRIPTTPVFGTDSYNLQSNPSSTGNNILTHPTTHIPSSSSAPLFAANGGGVSLDSFGKSPPNVDSLAQRATSFTSHSADQMNRLEGNVDSSEQSAMLFTTCSADQMCGLQGSQKNPYSQNEPPLAFSGAEFEHIEDWLLYNM